jgi:hypothetical protein
MLIILRTVALFLLLLREGHAQACADEETALTSCLVASNVDSLQQYTCSACLGSAVLSAIYAPNCNYTASVSCTVLEGCVSLCSALCNSEMAAKVTCLTNDAFTDGTVCPVPDCANVTPAFPGPSTGTQGPTITPRPSATSLTAPSPTPPTVCVDEATALDTCLVNSDGFDSLFLAGCAACMDTVAPIGASVLSACEVAKLSCAGCNGVCGTSCNTESAAKLTCLINGLGNDSCPNLCTSAASGETNSSACVDEASSLNGCLDTNLGSNADKAACEVCLQTIALSAYILPSCDLIASTSCAALPSCASVCGGESCSAEMVSKLACNVNDVRSNGTECPEPDCGMNLISFPSSAPLDSTPSTNTSTACVDESSALIMCAETNGADQSACEFCTAAAIQSISFVPTCDNFITVGCVLFEQCVSLCGTSCAAEITAKIVCGGNSNRIGDDCTAFDCNVNTGPTPAATPPTSPTTTSSGSTPTPPTVGGMNPTPTTSFAPPTQPTSGGSTSIFGSTMGVVAVALAALL